MKTVLNLFFFSPSPKALQRCAMALSVALITAMFSAVTATNSFAAPQEKEAKARLQQVQDGIQKLKNSVTKSTVKRSKTEQALRKTETEIANASKRLRKVSTQIRQGQKRLIELQGKQSQLSQALRRQQSALNSDVRSAYMQGRQERVKLLLNQEQPEKLARTLRYYDYFHRSRSNRINEFVLTLSDLEQVALSINSEKIALGKLKSTIQSQRGRLEKSQVQRKSVIKKLDQELSGSGNKLSRLLTDELELQALLEAVQQTLDDLPPDIGQVGFNTRRGKLPWPANGAVTRSYGSPKAGSKLRWKGIVIAAREGSDVTAVHHGRVIFSDWLRGVGLLLILDHGDGYFSLYGHNQALLKESGDWVTAGDTIASVGNSGGQAKTGLYFEIRASGKPTNPAPWIANQ